MTREQLLAWRDHMQPCEHEASWIEDIAGCGHDQEIAPCVIGYCLLSDRIETQ